MKLTGDKATINQLQWLVWIAVGFIIFFSLLPEDGFLQAGSFTLISLAFYVAVIYGNILYLYPRLYLRGRKVQYVMCVIILLVGGGFLRGYTIMYLYNKYFNKGKWEMMNFSMILNFVIAGFLTYLLSFIFRIAIAYFSLKQQSEKILAQKSQAELDLLKSQVQPHFLFNTLNNIYYEAYREAPRTAALIERLSDIMRYFVDESPKAEVALQTEVQFIENYIALEQIRIRHETAINFIKDFKADTRIPPMLFMTFVENIFKHGIDKTSSENIVDILLKQQDDGIIFQTRNKLYEHQQRDEHGFGIENLRKRLNLLYGNAFDLNVDCIGQYFTAFLKVPLA